VVSGAEVQCGHLAADGAQLRQEARLQAGVCGGRHGLGRAARSAGGRGAVRSVRPPGCTNLKAALLEYKQC
jgi:hypothetical protein